MWEHLGDLKKWNSRYWYWEEGGNILSYLLVRISSTFSSSFPYSTKAIPATETVIKFDRTSKCSTKDGPVMRFIGQSGATCLRVKKINGCALYRIRPLVHVGQYCPLGSSVALQSLRLQSFKWPSSWEPLTGVPGIELFFPPCMPNWCCATALHPTFPTCYGIPCRHTLNLHMKLWKV